MLIELGLASDPVSVGMLLGVFLIGRRFGFFVAVMLGAVAAACGFAFITLVHSGKFL